jgi:hypothetical protein
MSEMLIDVPRIPGSASEATTIPVQKTRRKVAKLCRVPFMALPILISGTTVMASEDVKLYPGAICQSQNGTDRVTRDINGKMSNASGTNTINQNWICPVVRDVEAADGVEFAAISVITTPAQTPPLTCAFRSMAVDGRLVEEDSNPVVVTDPNNRNLKRFQFAGGDRNIRK